jgi:hypothetical protein
MSSKPLVHREIRTVSLTYGQEKTVDMPKGFKFLGLHCQPEGGVNADGKANRRYVRTVEPKLVYLFEAGKELAPVTFLLLRGEAELPLDSDTSYDFLDLSTDRNPQHSGFATLWIVSKKRQASGALVR